MTDILFVDDKKNPQYYGLPDNTIVARTGEVAWRKVKMRSINKPVEELWLDFDLGEGINGLELLRKMAEKGMSPKKVVCISGNPVGQERIRYCCEDNNIPFESRWL